MDNLDYSVRSVTLTDWHLYSDKSTVKSIILEENRLSNAMLFVYYYLPVLARVYFHSKIDVVPFLYMSL